MRALRTLDNDGVMNTTLQIVFKSVAVAKLVYAANAWYGFVRQPTEISHPPRNTINQSILYFSDEQNVTEYNEGCKNRNIKIYIYKSNK